MLTLIFSILLIVFLLKVIGFAIKATWGILKVVLTIVFFPLILVVMAFSGLISVAIIILVIAVIGTLIGAAFA